MPRYYQAVDTFAAELDGVHMSAQKNATLPEDDPLVQHDLKHGGKLFRLLDTSDPDAPPKRGARGKA